MCYLEYRSSRKYTSRYQDESTILNYDLTVGLQSQTISYFFLIIQSLTVVDVRISRYTTQIN